MTIEAMVRLTYKGYPYYARDVRYWLRSDADEFVYGTAETLDEAWMLAEGTSFLIYDREAKEYVK